MESREDLKAYLDGELNESQAEAVRVAAEADPTIRKELEGLRLVGSTLSAMAKEYEVHGLENTLRALDGDVRRAGVTAPKKRWTWYGVGVGIAAAVTLLYALPPMWGTAKMAAKSSLASRSFVASDVSAEQSFRRQSPLAAAIRPPRFSQPTGAGRAGMGATPMKPPPSPQELLKADEAKLKQLQDENARLKSERAATSRNLVPPGGMSLPAPMPPGEIVPSEGVSVGASPADVDAAKGVPPQRIAQLEAQVKKLAVSSGAKVESASGPTVMRVVSLTSDSTKAAHLAEQIRSLLKTAGSVTIEAIPPAGESAVVQSTKAKIVDLKLQKDRLLVDFLPEAPQVQELDRQIKILEGSIKPESTPPKSRLHVSIG